MPAFAGIVLATSRTKIDADRTTAAPAGSGFSKKRNGERVAAASGAGSARLRFAAEATKQVARRPNSLELGLSSR